MRQVVIVVIVYSLVDIANDNNTFGSILTIYIPKFYIRYKNTIYFHYLDLNIPPIPLDRWQISLIPTSINSFSPL